MDHLSNPYVSAFDVPIIGSIVSGAVQFFFVYRVWVLSDRKAWRLCLLISVVSRLYPVNRPRAHLIRSVLHLTLQQHLLGVFM